MSLFYSVAYRLGFTPWEKAAFHSPAARHIEILFAREETGQPPYGRALDIGCGRGHWSIALSERGWDVTGIDRVPKAVVAAQQNSLDAGVIARFIEGDITRMRDAGVGSGYRLFWDFGAIHGLDEAQRRAAGRQISAIAASDAVLLMLAWAPGRRWPLPRGLSREDIEDAFPRWRITDAEPFDVTGLPWLLRRVRPTFYRLRYSG